MLKLTKVAGSRLLTGLILLVAASADGEESSTARPVESRTAKEEDDSIQFRESTVCASFAGGYQVAVADVNGDGGLDVVGLGEAPGAVEWFENPGRATGD